jgi:hypothetical protein
MLQIVLMSFPAHIGFAVLHASTDLPSPEARESAGLATFLFGVLGLLLAIFFLVVLLSTMSRALRRKRNESVLSEPTDTSVDPWSEAGKRLGRAKSRRDSSR